MSASHKESWPTATSPRHLLKLTRVRPSGRQYTLLACGAVRRLMPWPPDEQGERVLHALERFAVAQPRKGVQTHLWNEVVRPAVPEVSDRLWITRLTPRVLWLHTVQYRLEAFSQVNTAAVNAVFDLALHQAAAQAGREAAAEVRELCDRLTPAPEVARVGWFGRLIGSAPAPKPGAGLSIQELRDEITSRCLPERRDDIRSRWFGVADIATAKQRAGLLITERVEQRKAELSATACDLIREVFGNPFRPPHINPDWLAWNHGAVRHIAESVVASGSFTDLPILADALEDAGCADAELLAHLRSGGPHAPGCWALDAVLGR